MTNLLDSFKTQMMKNRLPFILILCFTITSFGQVNLEKANNLFEKRSYLKAASIYENITNKEQTILQKLGDCYYFNTQIEKANKWYSKLIKLHPETISDTYIFRYAQTLKGLKRYDEADKWFQKYYNNQETNYKPLAQLEAETTDTKRPYTVVPVSINTTVSDFGIATNQNKAYFASSRNTGENYDWNNQPYLDLFTADVTENGDLTNVKPLSEKVNSKMHESNAVITKDGKTMYFTRNNFTKRTLFSNKQKVNNLKIYKAQLVNNEWENITELPFNSDSYSVEHPTLSNDEKHLYFASDMPGTIGSLDIFVVTINDDNTYGTPKNLGESINTQHREQFPFISNANNLYFASDGHAGFGGLDIFKSSVSGTNYDTPSNLGSTINSNLDDFAFSIDEDSETGYLSSNRTGGKGDDDIYKFTRKKIYYVNGVVQDKNSLALLPNSEVTLLDANNKVINKQLVKEDAAYKLEILPSKNYILKGAREYYIPQEISFATDEKGNINKDIFLNLESYKDAEEKIVVERGELQIKINPIYFDFDKWNIRSDAALELDQVVAILKEYPEMKIEVGAHTDFRGTNEYNMVLSDKRAKSVHDYLVSKGIAIENVSFKGYGETKPVNECIKYGVCKEEGYDLNRRCEFVILK